MHSMTRPDRPGQGRGRVDSVKRGRMRTRLAIFGVVAVAIALAGWRPLSAHHSFAAQYDGSKAIRLTGVLTKVEWTNPHTYFYLDVKEPDGTVVQWGFEAGSPGALSRRGFKRSDLKLGDTLIVDGYRARDGSRLADARRVTLPDGRIVSGASASRAGTSGRRRQVQPAHTAHVDGEAGLERLLEGNEANHTWRQHRQGP